MKNTTPDPKGRRRVTAGVFRDKSLGLLAEVARTGREIVVTRHGREIAIISPALRRPGNTFIGSSKNSLTIESPIEMLNSGDGGEGQKALPPGQAVLNSGLDSTEIDIDDDIDDYFDDEIVTGD